MCKAAQTYDISIHTPAKGVTDAFRHAARTNVYFNPHPREGGDRFRAVDSTPIFDFNPHPREGGDRSL